MACQQPSRFTRNPGEIVSVPRKLQHLAVERFIFEYGGKRSPSYSLPRQVGYFSQDGNSEIHFNDSELKYLCLPKNMNEVYFDLDTAYELGVKNDYLNSNYEAALKWIAHNKSTLQERCSQVDRCQRKVPAEFICFRGLLTKIMQTPYRNEPWILCAIRYRGNLYVRSFRTEQEIQERMNSSEQEKRMTSWGLKFEQFLTSDAPYSSPTDPKIPNNEFCKFYCMVQSALGNSSFMMCSEMDGLRPNFTLQHAQSSGSLSGYVEMKTVKLIKNPKQANVFYRHKLRDSWAQSYISGVPTIYFGFRDDNGIVRKVKEYRTEDLPNIAKKGLESMSSSTPYTSYHQPHQNVWNPSVCLNFLDVFLTMLKQEVVKDDPKVVYKFDWSPGHRIQCTEITEEGPYHFLPDWFISEMS